MIVPARMCIPKIIEVSLRDQELLILVLTLLICDTAAGLTC